MSQIADINLIVQEGKNGCFSAFYVCSNCLKVLLEENITWSKHHINIEDKDKIKQYMKNKATEKELHFCFKCGAKIDDSI